MHDIKENHISWPNNPVAESVGVGLSSRPGDTVDALYQIRAQGEQRLVGNGNQVVFSDPRSNISDNILIGCIHHGCSQL